MAVSAHLPLTTRYRVQALTGIDSTKTTLTSRPAMANRTHTAAVRARMDKPATLTIKIPHTTLATHTPRDSMTDKDTVRLVHLICVCAKLTLATEMTNMNGSDPNRILNECRQIDAEVDQLDARQERLRQMQRAFIGDTDTSAESQTRRQVDAESADLLQDYRALVARTKRVKQDKESGNPRNAPQVGRVDRKVKGSMNKLQQLDSDFRRQLQDRMERDYRIVRPDASDAEVREAVQDPNQQVFSQALISSDRRGQAQSVAQSVRSRHNAIQKIEQDMLQLAEMFQDLDALVIQQEAAVTQIEQRGEEVTDHAAKANTELDGAVKKARAARKKKWICLGIAGESYPLNPCDFLSLFLQQPFSSSSLLFSNLYFSRV